MTRPTRIQRKRTKDWVMPENTVYVGRPTKWGNPFVVGKDGTAQECVNLYKKMTMPYTHLPPTNGLEELFISEANIADIIRELKGKDLVCWCKIGEPCHADVLLEIANMEIV